MAVFNDMEATIGKAPESERAGLYQAIADAFAGYYASYSDEREAPAVPAGVEIFDHIRNYIGRYRISGSQMIGGFVKEFSRMAKQQEKQGAGPIPRDSMLSDCRIKSFPRPPAHLLQNTKGKPTAIVDEELARTLGKESRRRKRQCPCHDPGGETLHN